MFDVFFNVDLLNGAYLKYVKMITNDVQCHALQSV